MKREVFIAKSFAEADEADRRFYASLTPRERLDILLELVARWQEGADGAAEGFARVYRIVELERS